MDNMTIAGGVGALVLGFIIGNVTSGGGVEFDDPGPKLSMIEGQIAELAAGNTATRDALTSLSEGSDATKNAIAVLTEENKATGAALAALGARFDASDAALESVGGNFDGVSTQLGSIEEKMGAGFAAIEGAVSSQTESLKGSLAEMAPAAAGSVAAVAATAVAAVAGSAESEETAPTQMAATSDAQSDSGFGVGRTANLAGGEIRAFVSRVDTEAGLVEVAVNGLDRISLSAGRATGFAGVSGGACLLSVLGVADGAAELGATCGDDRPEPHGVAPGVAADLASGVRAFVSYGANNMARIAINGQKTQTIAVGKSAPVEGKSCSVKVEGVDRGMVALSTDC